jgi:hypothetical protein
MSELISDLRQSRLQQTYTRPAQMHVEEKVAEVVRRIQPELVAFGQGQSWARIPANQTIRGREYSTTSMEAEKTQRNAVWIKRQTEYPEQSLA